MRSKTKSYLDCLGPFASRFIRGKVRQLLKHPCYRGYDRHDLIHDLVVDLLQRKVHFDPAAATWEAFVVVVCENRCASLLKHRKAEMRSVEQEAPSLNEPTLDADGHPAELGDTLTDDVRERRTGQSRLDATDAFELTHDVAVVLESLPPQLRTFCEHLKSESISQTARDLGMNRVSAHDRLVGLRRRFERAGLKKNE